MSALTFLSEEDKPSEMEKHLVSLIDRIRRREVAFMAVTVRDFDGVIEQRHLRASIDGPAATD